MSEDSSRGFPRPISATLHGATDYQVGTLLMTLFPRLAGIQGTESARQVRVSGAVHVGYSTLTAYPLGVVKLIPYKAHLGLDAVGALALAATPFVTGQWTKGRKHWVPHVALAAFELTSLVFSDPTGAGDQKVDLEAVREANTADPGAAIRNAPAVVAGSAGSPDRTT